MYKTLLTQTKESSLIISINREDKMNALTLEVLREMGHAIEQAQSMKGIRGIVITGAGSKAFAAGADISEFAEFSPSEARDMSRNGHQTLNSIEQSRIPVSAAVNGFALGGGCELAMACHVRIASRNAKFGQPEVNLGVPPGYGGTQRLAQIIGKGRALDLLISARTIDAQQALDLGLVTSICESEELLLKTMEYIQSLKHKSPRAIAEVIACVNALYDSQDGFEFEIDSFSASFQTKDFKTGTSAFLRKQKPEYD
jgi:enoyl-CoA hydratase